jgi:hypothetical protein
MHLCCQRGVWAVPARRQVGLLQKIVIAGWQVAKREEPLSRSLLAERVLQSSGKTRHAMMRRLQAALRLAAMRVTERTRWI